MVPRRGLSAVLALVLAAGAAGSATPAGAVSRKVAIGDFAWSPFGVTVDRGDTVTWFWVGPDTQHSVTGEDAFSAGIDSDPGDDAPSHAPGDRFKVRFDRPGVYALHCKLHALVRGKVTVLDEPGTGAPSPDPDPQVTLDLRAPELTQVRWAAPALRTGHWAQLRYTLDERARVTFDVMRPRRGVDRLVGTRRFRGHVGWNTWRFHGRLRHRRLRPGRYYALLVAADADGNRTRDVRLPFRVRR